MTQSSGTVSIAAQATLPRITLPRFGGNLTRWAFFWETFQSLIDSQNFDPVLKFYHLKNLLHGDDARVVSGLSTTTANYPIALSLLQKAFGNNEAICQRLRTQLLTFTTRDTTPSGLMQAYYFVQQLYKQLESLGDNPDCPSHTQILEAGFPKFNIAKVMNKVGTRKISTSELLTHLGEILEANLSLDRLYQTNNPITTPLPPRDRNTQRLPGQNRPFTNNFARQAQYDGPSRHHPMVNRNQSYRDPPQRDQQPLSSTFAATTSPAAHTNRPRQSVNTTKRHPSAPNNFTKTVCCLLCSKGHYPKDCTEYSTFEATQQICNEKPLCKNCLKPGHKAINCPSKFSCKKCNKRHHTSLCRLLFTTDTSSRQRNHANVSNDFYDDGHEPSFDFTAISDADISPVESLEIAHNCESAETCHPPAHETTVYSRDFPSLTSPNEVLMMSCTIKVSHPHHPEDSITATVFLDSGSTRSYASQERAHSLNVNTFATEEPTVVDSTIYPLTLHLLNSESLQINVTAVPFLTSKIRSVSMSLSDIPALLKGSVLPVPISTVKPSILIGSDYLQLLLDNSEVTQLPSGLYLLLTKVGYLLTGKLVISAK